MPHENSKPSPGEKPERGPAYNPKSGSYRRFKRRAPDGFSYSKWQTYRERFHLTEHESLPKPDRTFPISNALTEVVRSLGLEPDLWKQELFEKWESIVGPNLAEHTRPGRIQGRTLYVYVPHPVWLAELQSLHRDAMLRNIMKSIGDTKITSLRFQIDPEPS